MSTNRVVFSMPRGTIQIEGSEAFLSETISKLNPEPPATEASETLISAGLDHAWDWFSLHATQRLQGMYFFLLASAFLSGAYVSALHFELWSVAAGLGVLGLVFSVGFHMLESRVRELLKAGEQALKPAQRKLAELTGVASFTISDNVETPKYWITSYSKIFRMLFLSAIVGSAFGTAYAIYRRAPGIDILVRNNFALVVFYRCVLVVAAAALVRLSSRLASLSEPAANWLSRVVVVAMLSGGLVLLIVCALRPLT